MDVFYLHHENIFLYNNNLHLSALLSTFKTRTTTVLRSTAFKATKRLDIQVKPAHL